MVGQYWWEKWLVSTKVKSFVKDGEEFYRLELLQKTKEAVILEQKMHCRRTEGLRD